jgi:hypothetical protein
MRDTRQLFANLCSRKETQWEGMPHPKELDDARMGALMALPQKIVTWDTSPMDDIFYKPKDKKSSSAPTGQLEWVVQRMGESDLQYYYVNTEGYAYARYGFRFTPRAGETGT